MENTKYVYERVFTKSNIKICYILMKFLSKLKDHCIGSFENIYKPLNLIETSVSIASSINIALFL